MEEFPEEAPWTELRTSQFELEGAGEGHYGVRGQSRQRLPGRKRKRDNGWEWSELESDVRSDWGVVGVIGGR